MKKFEGMQKETRTRFLINVNREEEIDDFTFNMWKSELQKELHSFWESMSALKK